MACDRWFSHGEIIFLGELNNLELWGDDAGNAHLEAYTHEKWFIIAGAGADTGNAHLEAYTHEQLFT